MDEIDLRQQDEIDAAAKKNAQQDAKDSEHDYKFARQAVIALAFGAWLVVLTLASLISCALESRITVTVEPRQESK